MLITLEGIDGSGKSTQATFLEARLKRAGRDALLIREPGGTALSERLRAILLDKAQSIDPFAEMLLFSAARRQLVVEQLKPALAQGTVIVCDRFYDSTIAYQGGGRALSEFNWLRDFQHRVVQALVPDRTYLIELSPEEAQTRRFHREGQPGAQGEDRMEAAGLEFQRRVAATYARLADAEPDRICRLDGRKPPEVLHEEIWTNLQSLLPAA